MIGISSRVLLSISLAIVGVGALDALISREWDLFSVLILSAVVQLYLWVRQRTNRVPVGLRHDLAEWLNQRAQRNGEPFEDVLDRAVAWYRGGLLRSSDTDEPVSDGK
jgi:hypothetical protein